MRKYIFILAFLAFTIPTRVAYGQSPKGTIRGTVIDKVTKVTLPGANVLLLNVNPIAGTTTNEEGDFRLDGVDRRPRKSQNQFPWLQGGCFKQPYSEFWKGAGHFSGNGRNGKR